MPEVVQFRPKSLLKEKYPAMLNGLREAKKVSKVKGSVYMAIKRHIGVAPWRLAELEKGKVSCLISAEPLVIKELLGYVFPRTKAFACLETVYELALGQVKNG